MKSIPTMGMLILVVGLLLLPGMAVGTDCEIYGDQLSWKSSIARRDGNYVSRMRISWPWCYSLADGDLVVMNIEDAEQPFVAATYTLPFSAWRMNVSEDLMLVSSSGKFATVDVSDPLHPVLRDTSLVPYSPYDACIAETQAWVLKSYTEINILDTTLGSNLELLGQYEPGGWIRGVLEHGGYCYIGTYDDLTVMDFSDPTNPVQIWSSPITVRSMTLDGSFLLVCGAEQTMTFWVNDPAAPVLMENSITEISGQEITANNGIVALYDYHTWESQLFTMNAYGALDFVSAFYQGSSATGFMLLANEHLYMANDFQIDIFSVDLTPLQGELASLPAPKQIAGMVIRDGYGFTAVQEFGLCVFDLADAENPFFAGSGFTPHQSSRIGLQGDWAILAGDHGLTVLDIQDPTLPVFLGSITDLECTNITGFALSENVAWISQEYRGTVAVNFTDPSNMFYTDIENIDPGVMAIEDGLLHTVDADDVYHVYSLDSMPPLELGALQLDEYVYDIVVDGSRVLVGHYNHLSLLDIGDPENISLLSFTSVMKEVYCLTMQGNSVVVTTQNSTLILDISEENKLLPKGTIWDVSIGHNILAGGEILVRHYANYMEPGSFAIFPAPCQNQTFVPEPVIAGATLLSIYPNPFNPQTSISFDLPHDSTITLRVYDLNGRLVANILEGDAVTAGLHSWSWNGRDKEGRTVSSGIYLVQLHGDGISASGRMALIR